MGTRLLIALAALAACERTSAKYCGIHPTDYAHCPVPDGALVGCTGNSDCPKNVPRCETGEGLCVQCLADMDCAAPTPKCDLVSHQCEQCNMDTDCGPGSRCLVGGVCSNDNNVAYVNAATGSDNADCTQAMPCLTIGAGLATGKPFVDLSGTFEAKGPIVNIPNSVDVTIIGEPGAKLIRDDNGAVVLIGKDGHVALQQLDISCASPAAGPGIQTMAGTFTFSQLLVHGCGTASLLGIVVGGGSLTMTRSKIYDWSATGVTLMGPTHFEITNSMIVHNGSAGADVIAAGIILGMGTTGDSFEFNTVADNTAKVNMMKNAGGIACPMGFALPDDIFAANTIVMGPTPMSSNLGMGCVLGGSLQQATDVGLNFVNPLTSPYDYHLMTGSLAVDGAPPDTNVTVDYDGDPRPMGNGYDYGADEL